MSNDDFDEMLRFLGEMAARHQEAVISQYEASWHHPTLGEVPLPNECHPYYERQRNFIRDWLDGFTFPNRNELFVLNTRRQSLHAGETAYYPTETENDRKLVLTRGKCVGLAPYVGREFVYMWHIAVDKYGRTVSGEAVRVYREGYLT